VCNGSDVHGANGQTSVNINAKNKGQDCVGAALVAAPTIVRHPDRAARIKQKARHGFPSGHNRRNSGVSISRII
jgi:hypothetical protein